MVSPRCSRSSNCCGRIERVVEDSPNRSSPHSRKSVNIVQLTDLPVPTDRPSVDDKPY